MKKAVVVGGSNGIGLAFAINLIKNGYFVSIFDVLTPNEALDSYSESWEFIKTDLRDFNEDIFAESAENEDVDLLMITAGFGRVAPFEALHTAEIKNMMNVNASAVIRIIRTFYEKLKSSKPFYCGVMGSIAGLVSSPLFSVYAASKAAVCRFTESVNIELEESGTKNRILNVSPGSVKGTGFNGGSTNVSEIVSLAESIYSEMQNHSTLYIPEYEPTFRGVIDRYKKDEHEFGKSSYEYKTASGRLSCEKKVRIGYLSGTFDLFHIGHLNLLKRAKEQCDYLIVGVHPDASHKGKETFIPFEERKSIVSSIRYVDKVVQSCREDSDAWDLWHYTKLFVGSDYKGTERFNRYEEYFKDKGVEIVFFPYTKGTSSTQLRDKISK